MPDFTNQALVPVLVLLFIIWLIHRIETRMRPIAKKAVYDNFPFLKNSVDNVEQKLKYINTRMESMEVRIAELEEKIKVGKAS